MNGVRRARESDWTAVAGLLEDSGLPMEGAREHFGNVLVIGEPLYACAGFEKHGSFGLLRDFRPFVAARNRTESRNPGGGADSSGGSAANAWR